MNKDQISDVDMEKKIIDSESLSARLSINQKYQSRDFQNWLQRRLNVFPGENVLDVGCGTGAQSLRFLDAVGENGTVSSLDISKSSIEKLQETSGHDKRLETIVADMADLEKVIKNKFRIKKYTLAHSSYALYYSPHHRDVLRRMVDSIYSHGRVAIFTPVFPHGMVEIASKFSEIPKSVFDSLEFGPKVLEPELRSLFWDVEVHFFQSEMRVTSLTDFMSFYKATTYFDIETSEKIQEYAQSEIRNHGAITYEKNGYLIIGRDKRNANDENY